MEDAKYAVHTRSCTFLLDEEGLCHFIVSRTGMVPPEIRGCVGSQFVACLHPELEGGLAGELIVGASALFAKKEAETGRMVLMRSGPIVRVELRGVSEGASSEHLSDSALDLASGPPLSMPGFLGVAPSARGGDTVPPPPSASAPDYFAAVGESTVTLTVPLYRPEAQPLRSRRE